MNKLFERILAIFLSIIIVFGTNIVAFAQTSNGTCGANVKYNFDEKTATLTFSGTGEISDNFSYSQMAPWNNLLYSEKIQNIVFEEGITKIPQYAFYNQNKRLNNVKSISFASTIASIGAYSFAYLSGVNEIKIPDSVTIIETDAFRNSSAKKVLIGASVSYIESGAFNCPNLTDVYFRNSEEKCKKISVDSQSFPITVKKHYDACVNYEHNVVKNVTKATLKRNGFVSEKCSVCGYYKKIEIAYPKQFLINNAKYTGKPVKPSIIIKDAKGKIISNSNYNIKYSDNKAVGTGKAVVSFKNNYSGIKTVTFKIKDIKGSIKLNKTSANIKKGEKITLKVAAKPAKSVKWKTSNDNVAVVSQKGVVKGKSCGKATITASFKYKGKTYKKSCEVKVANTKSKKVKAKLTIENPVGSEVKCVRIMVVNNGDYPLTIKNPLALMTFRYFSGAKYSISGYMKETRSGTTKFIDQNSEFIRAFGNKKVRWYEFYEWYPYYYNTIEIPAHNREVFYVELEDSVVITSKSVMSTYFTYCGKEYFATFGKNSDDNGYIEATIPRKETGFNFSKPADANINGID